MRRAKQMRSRYTVQRNAGVFHPRRVAPGGKAKSNRYTKRVTYGMFLLIFLCVPTVVLVGGVRRRVRRFHLVALGMVCLLAFLYTTPWDNYAAYKRLWSFDPSFVWGPPLWFGYLPLEEYLFYFAEAVFVCLMLVGLARVPALRPEDAP